MDYAIWLTSYHRAERLQLSLETTGKSHFSDTEGGRKAQTQKQQTKNLTTHKKELESLTNDKKTPELLFLYSFLASEYL